MIDGRLEVTNVTFARFSPLDGCNYQPFAITNNPLSPDAVHPTEVRGAVKINVDRAHIAHYYPPNPEWINQEVHICMLFVGIVQYMSQKTSHMYRNVT